MSQQKEIGTLVVVVLKAQHLHQPSFYKQNPYVKTSLSGLTKRTKVDPKGGQHPVWDDELRFPVLAEVGKDRVNRILEISCYKDEQRGDDILLGKGTVDIGETLKSGEFDDWIPLETSAGARGEVYLEMTYYANAPPPLTRRPSKLSPSDRLARPAAYYMQSRQSTPKSTPPITSPQPGGSPAPGERKPSQPPPAGGSQIPSSLIPAHGLRSRASRQASPNGSATSVVAVKHRDDSLPPLPDDNDPTDVGSGKNPKLPAALHPGRGGPRPMPPQNRNRVMSTGRPPPEVLPDQLRRTLSDTPAVHAASPSSFSHLQTPVQSYSPEIPSTTGARAGLTPSIFVEEHVEDHPPLAFPTPFSPPPGPAQEREPRGVYAAGDYGSFTYGPPGPVYVQPNSQAYTPVPAQGFPRTFSPSQRPVPLQSPHTPPGQPPSHHQQYTQYPNGPLTSLPLSPPQSYPQLQSTQPQQKQPPYSPQPQQHPPQQQPYSPLEQQQYLPLPQQHQQQQQYHPQQLPYTQTPHPPQVPQPYQQHQHPGMPPSYQSQQQLPLHSQATPQPQQPYFAVPPPPPSVQSQTPQPYAPQLPHQPQSYFPPPPPPPPPPFPPPPPPPLHSQDGKGPSNQIFVAQPSQTPVQSSAPSQGPTPPPTSLSQSVTPATPLLQPSTTTPLPPQVVPNTTPAASTEEVVRQRQVEDGRNEAEPVAVAEAGTVLRGEVSGALQDVTRNQTAEEQSKKVVEEKQGQLERLKDTEERGVREEKECRQRMEEEDPQRREEELRKQEALNKEEGRKKQEEEEQRKREEEEQREREEERQREREEEQHRRREEEQRRRKEAEEQRRQEEIKFKRREEEECRRREEEERRVREEEERRKQEEEERRKQEEEEERIQREREEAERRRKAAEEQARRRRAEEAEAERRWQEELARIRARAEQEAADAAFARAQMEAEEAERRRQEEADFALVRQAQEEAEREERLAQERRQQEEADMEVARREQAHEEELERRRREERRKKIEDADRELARRLDMELNPGAELSSNGGDQPRQRGAAGSGGR